VAGVVLLLVQAITRLGSEAAEALNMGLTPLQWAIAISFTLFMLFTEGYKGFQQKFSPRLAVRTAVIGTMPLHAQLLAPLTLMALVHATPRRQIASWALVAMIVGFVFGVRVLAQPWRGVIDVGVVAGLSYGLATMAWELLKVWRAGGSEVDPEVPVR